MYHVWCECLKDCCSRCLNYVSTLDGSKYFSDVLLDSICKNEHSFCKFHDCRACVCGMYEYCSDGRCAHYVI